MLKLTKVDAHLDLEIMLKLALKSMVMISMFTFCNDHTSYLFEDTYLKTRLSNTK